MTRIESYPYGFILGERIELKVPESFKLLNVNENYYFYYDPISTLKYKFDSDKFIILHGLLHFQKLGIP